MADLYTSLVRAKQELNGGVLPAMTPIPEKLHAIFDPDFTIGMGAVMEDPEKGLRCPVRGCGKYFGNLTQHLNRTHAVLGGAVAVKRALDIQPRAVLRSKRMQEMSRTQMLARWTAGEFSKERSRELSRQLREKPPANKGKKLRTVGLRNFSNSCEAQLVQRILAARDRIGRIPSSHELRIMGESALCASIERIYGSWDSFMGQVNLRVQYGPRSSRTSGPRPRIARDAVIEAYRAWYEEHGSLPSRDTAHNPRRTPKIPVPKVVLRALNAESWPEAMESVAAFLGVPPGRYSQWHRRGQKNADPNQRVRRRKESEAAD
jgi:hypothetical protein